MPRFRSRVLRLALAAAFIVPLLVIIRLPEARASSGLIWPVQGKVARGFERPTGAYGEGGHQGLDMLASPGTAVRAAGDGIVAWVGEVPRGIFVSVQHEGGLRSTYLDVRGILVRVGDRVVRGQIIAAVSGSRDGSTSSPHLHFDTYLNGQPVDPRLLLGGLAAGSFVRLCPVKQTGGAGARGAPLAAGVDLLRDPRDRPGAVESGPPGGVSVLWQGLCAVGRGVARGAAFTWERVLEPAGRAISRFGAGIWSNRYVRAAVAGLAAALVVIAGVIVAFLLLPVSLVTAVVAGILGTLACLAMAIYYALTSGGDFTFAACFLKSLAAGGVAASGAVGWGALSSAFAAGWAEVGLAGALKAAAWNGVFSAAFDTGLGYLTTGGFSLRRAGIAFLVGAASGAVGKIIKQGILAEKFVRVFSATAESQIGLHALGRSAVILLQRVTVGIEVFVSVGRRLAIEFGGKVAYVFAWGSLTAGLNAGSCALAHRPITATGVISSFMVGAIMGTLSLSFGGKGISGLLSRFRLFQRGAGEAARAFVAKLAGKALSRGLDSGLESGLKSVIKEKEARIE